MPKARSLALGLDHDLRHDARGEELFGRHQAVCDSLLIRRVDR
jgi:hypothetical protein